MSKHEDVIIVTTPTISGLRVERVYGPAWGLVVRSRGLGGNIVAGLRTLAGGEIKEYTELLENTRQAAVERLREHAAALGANAVLGMRFDSSELGQSMSEIVAYGAAVSVVAEE